MRYKNRELPRGVNIKEIQENYIIRPLQIRLLGLEREIAKAKEPDIKKSLLKEYGKIEKEIEDLVKSPIDVTKKTGNKEGDQNVK